MQVFDEPPTWASWARIVLGVGLLVWGVREWVGRAGSDEAPAWMQSIEGATPAKAARLALLLSVANPKIVLLAAAAGLAISAAELSSAGTLGAAAVFTGLAATTVALPVLLYALLGARMLTPLASARDWLQANNAAVMAVVIAVIGALLIARGLSGL